MKQSLLLPTPLLDFRFIGLKSQPRFLDALFAVQKVHGTRLKWRLNAWIRYKHECLQHLLLSPSFEQCLCIFQVQFGIPIVIHQSRLFGTSVCFLFFAFLAS